MSVFPLDINLISTNNKGTLIISNLEDITKTNWEIKIKLNNFQITSMSNVNFSQDEHDLSILIITPKEWKINIESKSQIVSNFLYSGLSTFDYEILDVKATRIEPDTVECNNKIRIIFENNTDKEIVIKPGEKYCFSV